MSDHAEQADNVWAELEEGHEGAEHSHANSSSGSHHSEHEHEENGHEEVHAEDEAETVEFRPKKSKLPIYLAVGATALAGVGIAGFLVMKVVSGSSGGQKVAQMEQPLDSVAALPPAKSADLSSIPGGSSGASSSGVPVQGVAIKDASIAVSEIPVSQSALNSATASPAAPISVPVSAMVNTLQPAVTSTPVSVKPALVKDVPKVETTIKVAPVSSVPVFVPPVVADIPRKPVRVRTPKHAAQYAYKEMQAVPPVVKPNPQHGHKASSKHSVIIDEVEEKPKSEVKVQAVLSLDKDLIGYKIFAFSSDAGVNSMVYLKRADRMLMVREGELIPDGSKITKIDMHGWKVTTSNGVIR